MDQERNSRFGTFVRGVYRSMASKRDARSRFERVVMSVLASIVGLAGLAAIGYGAWCIYEPAGYVIGGVELLVLSWRLT